MVSALLAGLAVYTFLHKEAPPHGAPGAQRSSSGAAIYGAADAACPCSGGWGQLVGDTRGCCARLSKRCGSIARCSPCPRPPWNFCRACAACCWPRLAGSGTQQQVYSGEGLDLCNWQEFRLPNVTAPVRYNLTLDVSGQRPGLFVRTAPCPGAKHRLRPHVSKCGGRQRARSSVFTPGSMLCALCRCKWRTPGRWRGWWT